MKDYWNIIFEVIREVDDKHLDINVYTYDYEDDKKILVFGDTESSEQFSQMLKERMKDIPEVKQDIEDAIYNVFDKSDWWIEKAVGGYEYWTYMDEGFECSECGKWHYFDYYNATGYTNYKIYDGWIECEDCIRKDKEHKEQYIEDLIDNPSSANTILEYGDLLDLGFEEVNESTYRNGWYGREDNPKEIFEEAKKNEPNYEFLFSIRKNYNPWETEFDLYKREVC